MTVDVIQIRVWNVLIWLVMPYGTFAFAMRKVSPRVVLSLPLGTQNETLGTDQSQLDS